MRIKMLRELQKWNIINLKPTQPPTPQEILEKLS
jgi:hypothetical protein